MTNKQLYFVNRSVLFLAIAYAINGYTLPALACSIISAFLTCEFIGYEKVKDSLMQVLVMGVVLIGMIRMVGLQVNLPMLEVSAYASALFAVNWVKYHFLSTYFNVTKPSYPTYLHILLKITIQFHRKLELA